MVTDWWALKEAAEPSPFLIAAATHSGKRQRERVRVRTKESLLKQKRLAKANEGLKTTLPLLVYYYTIVYQLAMTIAKSLVGHHY